MYECEALFLKTCIFDCIKKHSSFLSVIIFIYKKYRGIWQIIVEFKVRFKYKPKIVNNH